MTSTSGQLFQRIRLYDEEEHSTQNNIMVDEISNKIVVLDFDWAGVHHTDV